MKRSALATAVLAAACGFVVTGVVVLPSALQADDLAIKAVAEPTIRTEAFTIRTQQGTEGPQLVVTNLTDQSIKAEWTQKLQSTGKANWGSRALPVMKDVSSESRAVDIAPRGAVTITVTFPETQPDAAQPAQSEEANKAKALLRTLESRQMVIEIGEQRLVVRPSPVEAPLMQPRVTLTR